MQVQQNHEVSDSRLADLLCSALEGGSNYWYRIERAIEGKGDVDPWQGDSIKTSGAYVSAFSTDGALIIQDTTAEEYEGEEPHPYRLGRTAMMHGLRVMAEKHPRHFADFLTENDDATTGDVFLQCCLFGEVRYG